MDLFKFLEIAREAAYCLLFSIGRYVLKSQAIQKEAA
jgi:hypothetical protein